jgi:hypothetical protein
VTVNPHPLDEELADLLTGHHVSARVVGDRVELPDVHTWADLRLFETETGRFLMEVRTATPGGPVLLDTWSAWGTSREDARRDGLRAFCEGTFHVLLAAVWGVLESDQAFHEVRTVGGQVWDVYLGPVVNRRSAQAAALVPPAGFVDAVLGTLDSRMLGTDAHVVRIYHAVSQGQVLVTEALWDGEPFPELQAQVAAADWKAGPAGFASARWFLALRPQVGGRPAHGVERTCG